MSEQVIASGDDVFAVRQRGRYLAEVIGFDEADQIRLATSLSELARDVLAIPGGGWASFDVDDIRQELVVTLSANRAADLAGSPAVAAARRLLPSVQVDQDRGSSRVVITRALPGGQSRPDAESIRSRLESQVVTSALDELRTQNRELLGALEQVNARQAELVQLNLELEDTNRGVISMYAELSDELDTTNQGVVALYAELDDTTRQLRAATEAKTRFLNNMSHELRSPISSVLALSRLLLEPDGGLAGTEQQRQVELIQASAVELLDLVDALLNLAKVEAGRLEPEAAETDLVALAVDVADALRPLAAPGVDVVVQAAGPVPTRTDSGLLRQVLRNLVANALAFTTEGAVTVSVATEGASAVIQVADTGIGIAADDLDRIFEEFYQVRGPLQARRRGTGLGLPYARTVAELLGGSLTVTSSPGVGSTFVVVVPLAAEPVDGGGPDGSRSGGDGGVVADSPAKGGGGPRSPGTPDRGMGRVLIVDDDAAMRTALAGMLSPVAAAVITADDGAQALALLAGSAYDVVVLDLVMPGIGGEDVLMAMADRPGLRDVPVVVVTSGDADLGRLQELGPAVAVVRKDGLEPDALRAVVAHAAGTRGGQG
ncbi:MAG: ATP-binding protein [Acidimicrobiales bacterium]